MTIDEAIEKERKQAEMYRCEYECEIDYYGKDFIDDYADELDCIKNMNEHKQYAEWLEELKMYKEDGYQCQHQCEGDIIKKLAEYEDLDEQGLLLKLPCKVGDIVYMIINQRDNYDDTIYQIVSATSFRLSMIDNIGKTVFLTQDEAEQKFVKH